MNFRARMIQFLGETGGTSKSGNPWKKKEWLVETEGQYPRKVRVQCFGDKSDNINMEPGKLYDLSVDLESREFNGRWYTDVNVFRVNEAVDNNTFGGAQGGYTNGYGQSAPEGVSESGPFGSQPFGGTQPTFTPSDDTNEDLPF